MVVSQLGPGGAERVAATMATYWADCGHDVTVVTTSDHTADFYQLDPRVKRIALFPPRSFLVRVRHYIARQIEGNSRSTHGTHPAGNDRQARRRRPLDGLRTMYSALQQRVAALFGVVARHRLLGRSSRAYASLLRVSYWPVRALRDVLTQTDPDVVFSLLGETNIVTVAASTGLRHRVVISERNDPSRQQLEAPWDDLRPIFYPVADAVSANSHGALVSMRAYCPEAKLCYVPNSVRLPARLKDATRSNAVLFLGRLAPQKAPEVLIEAFAQFLRTAPTWTLHLAGAGPLADPLRARVRHLGLCEHVTFHGVVDPAPLLATCRIFVLPSRFEGTPNALLEAMAHRLPCIVSDASPGPLGLIQDGTTGLVVKTGSAEHLAAAMTTLSRDDGLRRALGDAAHERVREFSLDRVGPIWDRVVLPRDPREPAGAPARASAMSR